LAANSTPDDGLGCAGHGAEEVEKVEGLHDVIVEAGVEHCLPIGIGCKGGQRDGKAAVGAALTRA
jgi:hypothetical protein